jgi:Flp pilus assembly protein TadD
MGKVGVSLAFVAVSFAQAQNPTQDAEAAFRSGDFNRATILARRVLAGDPNSVQAHILLGAIASETREWTAAMQNFEAVIHLAPSSPRGYFYLGHANLYQQKWTEAAKYIGKTLLRTATKYTFAPPPSVCVCDSFRSEHHPRDGQ